MRELESESVRELESERVRELESEGVGGDYCTSMYLCSKTWNSTRRFCALA